MADNQPNAQASSDKQFAIQKLYIKDASFESPNVPKVFTEEWKPDVEFNLNTHTGKAADDLYEVALTVTVTVKNHDKTAYLAEVTQVGIFGAKGFEKNEMGPLLGSFCPGILFPYLREAISDLVIKGGFPPMLLAPVNFDALYAQQSQKPDTKAN